MFSYSIVKQLSRKAPKLHCIFVFKFLNSSYSRNEAGRKCDGGAKKYLCFVSRIFPFSSEVIFRLINCSKNSVSFKPDSDYPRM
jgi:hypothetical protein